MNQWVKGVALISMLLLLTLVTVLTSNMLYQNTLEIKRHQTQTLSAQASEYARGGIALAEIWLRQNASLSMEQSGVFQPPGGNLAIQVSDEMGKFNLNNLRGKNGAMDQTQLVIFRRLLLALGLDQSLAPAVGDWVDADISSSGYNSEDLGYSMIGTREGRGYRAANRAMAHISELLLVRGFTPAIVDKLSPYVTVLPHTTPVNINSASQPVIEALMPDIDGQSVVQTVQQKLSGFVDIESFLKHHVSAGVDIPAQLLTTSSQYYLITVKASYQQQPAQWQALLSRAQEKETAAAVQIHTVWLRQLPFWATAPTLNNYE